MTLKISKTILIMNTFKYNSGVCWKIVNKLIYLTDINLKNSDTKISTK